MRPFVRFRQWLIKSHFNHKLADALGIEAASGFIPAGFGNFPGLLRVIRIEFNFFGQIILVIKINHFLRCIQLVKARDFRTECQQAIAGQLHNAV